MSEVHGFWVARQSIAMPLGGERLVGLAAKFGYKALIAQVRARGDAFYRSALEPRAEVLLDPRYDPLGYLLEKAHGAGLEVHAWLNAFFAWSGTKRPLYQNHVLNAHPEWLMVHQSGRPIQATDYEGYYLCPSNAQVQAHLWRVYMDVALRYPVDGIHFDYIRYPGPEFCYCRACQKAFTLSLIGREDPSQADAMVEGANSRWGPAWPDQPQYAAAWAEFRRQQTTDLVGAIYRRIKRAKPGITVSAAVFANATDAYKNRFQDWKGWLREGIVDVVCPMAYSKETSVVEAQVKEAMMVASGRQVWAGLGAWQVPPASTLEKIQAVRALGVHGIVLFSYGAITNDVADETYLRALAGKF